ncbi:hypothetical protein [Rhizobium binxianense]|uniref:hypothetical protein n=1 Tax=Rhizobium binxianense TaxID=3024242 RepID=UPI00234EFBB1|nr:hypothetical protein [Rhizobium sp. BC56]MDC7741197.1 hypothetical protein [Rhizobium sp. BC56]
MSDDRIQLWIGLCVVGGFCAYNWYWYIRSIIFYRKNGFDFSKDFGPYIYFSQWQHERFLAKPKAKFFFAMPFVLVVTSFISIFMILSLMGIIKPCMGCSR